MNAKYIRMRATADRLIRSNGAKFSLKRVVSSGFDPVTEESVTVEESQDGYMVMLLAKAGAPGKYDQFKGDDGSLDFNKIRDYLLSTQGLTWIPKQFDKVMYRGEWWTFETIQGLDPDGETDILYKGTIRRQ